jgi:hypothetical protein
MSGVAKSSFEKWWKEVEDLPHPDENIFTTVPVIARRVWNASRQQAIQEVVDKLTTALWWVNAKEVKLKDAKAMINDAYKDVCSMLEQDKGVK